MSVVTMKSLLEAGVHFGHQKRRWDPKMKPFIYTERNDIYIIDLQQTLDLVEQAYQFVNDMTSKGGLILFVGTKRQAQEAIKEAAEASQMPYVNNRWLGGTLTNFETVVSRIKRLDEIDRMEDEGEFSSISKKEVLGLNREREKLLNNLGGVRHLKRLPDALFVVDPKNERIATAEARRLKIPIVAIVDTNCNPDEVDYIIPGNDDAIRSIALVTEVIGKAAAEGHKKWAKAFAEQEIIKQKEKDAVEAEKQKEKEAAEEQRKKIEETQKRAKEKEEKVAAESRREELSKKTKVVKKKIAKAEPKKKETTKKEVKNKEVKEPKEAVKKDKKVEKPKRSEKEAKEEKPKK